MVRELTIDLPDGGRLSALAAVPRPASACLVLAHGAGAGMRHAFMEAAAAGLFARNVATLRYQFPYMEAGGKRPDRPAKAIACVRAAAATAATLAPDLPLVAGGKSFGGRMTSMAQAEAPLPGVRGLVFFGFPLHPAKAPAVARAAHLAAIDVPMLFLQGARDALADAALIAAETAKLPRATLESVADADHSFHVPKRAGRTDAEVMDALLDRAAAWIAAVTAPGSGAPDGSGRSRPRSPA